MIRDPLELPFDQYQRYRVVADLLDLVRDGAKPLAILDVGGRTANLRAFLPRDRVHLVDVDPSDEPGLVLGDGSRLPYQDRSFDVVAAFDTLEHVPPPARAEFVRECARVARKWVVLAGPYRADAVDESERLLQRFLRDKLGVEHRYLDEHRHNGLPDLAATTAVLADAGARTAAIGHGNLERWLPLMCLSLYLDHEPALRDLAKAIFRFYNRELYASDHASPVYRHAVVGALRGAPLPTAIPGLAPPRAPAGVLDRFGEVLGELAAFDRARGAWSIERERLWEMARTLGSDLTGHREALAAERELRTAGQRAVAVLEADLAGHRATLAEKSEELAEARAGIARLEKSAAEERGAVAAMRGELERELALVRAALAEADRSREADRARIVRLENDVDRAATAADALRADLAGHRETLVTERRDLAATRATLDVLQKDLVGHKTALAEHKARSEALARELSLARDEIAARGARIERYEADIERYETDIEQRKTEIAALRADLDGHRAALRDVSQDLDGHRAALRDTRAELASCVHERNVEQQRLEGAHGELARVARLLQEQDRAITALRADLRSRFQSLRRALGPKPPLPG